MEVKRWAERAEVGEWWVNDSGGRRSQCEEAWRSPERSGEPLEQIGAFEVFSTGYGIPRIGTWLLVSFVMRVIKRGVNCRSKQLLICDCKLELGHCKKQPDSMTLLSPGGYMIAIEQI